MDRRLEDRNLFRLRLSRSGRGHRPGPVPRVPQARRGSKPLARPAPPLGALRTRRVGRWPFVMPEPAGLQGTVPRGRGKRTAFPVPARRGVLRDALSLWQGPSPLPKRRAGIRTSRGPQPPASARPAPGGRFAPAGSGAGLLLFPDLPVCGAPSRRGGGNAVRFLVPPTLTKALSPLPWQGPSPLPQRHADPCPAGDQSPRPAPDPPTAGAGLSWRLDRPIYRAPCRAGGGNAARVSCSRPH